MNIYVKTRGFNREDDYNNWIPANYSDSWVDGYKAYIKKETSALIIQCEKELIRLFISDIPSKRVGPETSISYLLAFDVNYKEKENIENLEIIIKAWLYERFKAKRDKSKVIMGDSNIGKFLDKTFTKEYVDKLLSENAVIPSPIIDINELVKSCSEEAEKITINNKLTDYNKDKYFICNLKNNENEFENISIFYYLISEVINQEKSDEKQTCAFFNNILDLKPIINAIIKNKDFPKIICVDLDNFDADEIDDNSFDKIEKINDSCFYLKKKQKKTLQAEGKQKLKTLEQPKEQIKISNKDQQLVQASTHKIMTVVMAISLLVNLSLISLVIHQDNQIKIKDKEIHQLLNQKEEIIIKTLIKMLKIF